MLDREEVARERRSEQDPGEHLADNRWLPEHPEQSTDHPGRRDDHRQLQDD
jgi:hypothetical protein